MEDNSNPPFLFLLLLQLPTLSHSQTDSYYYDACAPYWCGAVHISFPFSSSESFCGLPGFDITCNTNSTPTITLSSGLSYHVSAIYRNDSFLTLSDPTLSTNLLSSSCLALRPHLLPAANFTPFVLPSWGITLNLSFCNSANNSVGSAVGCSATAGSVLSVLPPFVGLDGDSELPAGCEHAAAPVQQASLRESGVNVSARREDLVFVLEEGFPVRWGNNLTDCWECEKLDGRCGYNRSTGKFLCFCKNGCSGGGNSGNGGGSNSWKVIVAVVVPIALLLLAGVAAFLKFRAGVSSIFNSLNIQSISRSDRVDVEEFIKSYRSMLPNQYSYAEVRRITDGFKEKLGHGGYGSVYKGRLPNGQMIAAKILDKSTDNGRDFVSEVATIGTIRHVNIIRLLGFCCDGPRRALIYEFMPEGSLGDWISKGEVRHTLRVDQLLDIAIGIARGVEYLHQGCDKTILHLDIKPHNVLLDRNLNPKISDFGLAKSYSRKDSTVPLTAARGTVGYIAPEVFMSNLGGVSHKSDVYSYGMLLLEMVVGKRNPRPGMDNSSKEYFPNWVYDQVSQWEERESKDLVAEEDIGVSRKMTMVGLWCIQTKPIDRPSISGALGMLTGTTESIEMPPKPLLFLIDEPQSEHVASPFEDGSNSSSSILEIAR